jgi:hypothetical protein
MLRARILTRFMQMSKQRRKPGNYLIISLGTHGYAFGRELDEGNIAFYNIVCDQPMSIKELAGIPVAFIVPVHNIAVTSGRWKIFGCDPVTELSMRNVRYFREDQITGTVDIYSGGKFITYSGEDLERLERMAIWSADRVEERLVNMKEGRPDPQTEMFRYRAKNKMS